MKELVIRIRDAFEVGEYDLLDTLLERLEEMVDGE